MIHSLHMIDSFRTENSSRQGFTLIELLIVVAIIGILSSIVIVTLTGQGDKADDAKIKFELRQVSTVAVIYRNKKDNTNYANFCADTTDDGISNILASLKKTSGATEAGCSDTDDGWAVWAKSSTVDTDSDNDYFCIDSAEGIVTSGSAAPSGDADITC